MLYEFGYEINGRRIWIIDLDYSDWRNDYYFENGKWNKF